MTSNNPSIRAALAVLGTLCGVLALPAVTQAGSLTVNSTLTCSDAAGVAPAINMDPAGNLTITCTPALSGNPTTVPACTLNSPSITAGPSANATLVASCNPAATSFTWTNTTTANAPAWPNPMGNPVTLGPFTTAGSYAYQVTGTNTIGTSAAAFGTVTVSAAVGGSCPTAASTTQVGFTGTWVRLDIPRGGAVAVPLEVGNADGQYIVLTTIQYLSAPQELKAQIAISTCPGEFDTVAPECKTWGTVWGSATRIIGGTPGNPLGGCPMDIGKHYYANVRNVQFDLVTPDCPSSTCSMILQHNTTLQ